MEKWCSQSLMAPSQLGLHIAGLIAQRPGRVKQLGMEGIVSWKPESFCMSPALNEAGSFFFRLGIGKIWSLGNNSFLILRVVSEAVPCS